MIPINKTGNMEQVHRQGKHPHAALLDTLAEFPQKCHWGLHPLSDMQNLILYKSDCIFDSGSKPLTFTAALSLEKTKKENYDTINKSVVMVQMDTPLRYTSSCMMTNTTPFQQPNCEKSSMVQRSLRNFSKLWPNI